MQPRPRLGPDFFYSYIGHILPWGVVFLYPAEHLHELFPAVSEVVWALLLYSAVFVSYRLWDNQPSRQEAREREMQEALQRHFAESLGRSGQSAGDEESRLKRAQQWESVQRKRKIRADARKLRHEELLRIQGRRAQKLEDLYSLSPREFEDFTAEAYRRIGYSVVQTPYSNDGGKDAIAEKDGKRYLIECKRYGVDRAVGRPEVQKFSAAVVEERASKGIFVTTGRFTETAVASAKKHAIELIDGPALVNLVRGAFVDDLSEEYHRVMCGECGETLLFPVGIAEMMCSNGHVVTDDLCSFSETSSLPPEKRTCPVCRKPMRIVLGRKGKFWGCTGYPGCRYTEEM